MRNTFAGIWCMSLIWLTSGCGNQDETEEQSQDVSSGETHGNAHANVDLKLPIYSLKEFFESAQISELVDRMDSMDMDRQDVRQYQDYAVDSLEVAWLQMAIAAQTLGTMRRDKPFVELVSKVASALPEQQIIDVTADNTPPTIRNIRSISLSDLRDDEDQFRVAERILDPAKGADPDTLKLTPELLERARDSGALSESERATVNGILRRFGRHLSWTTKIEDVPIYLDSNGIRISLRRAHSAWDLFQPEPGHHAAGTALNLSLPAGTKFMLHTVAPWPRFTSVWSSNYPSLGPAAEKQLTFLPAGTLTGKIAANLEPVSIALFRAKDVGLAGYPGSVPRPNAALDIRKIDDTTSGAVPTQERPVIVACLRLPGSEAIQRIAFKLPANIGGPDADVQ